MKVSAQQLRLNTDTKTADLQGYKGGARQLLREMAADLVKDNGSICSGYLRLSADKGDVRIQAGHLGSGATAATSLVKKLVSQAYGEQASQALERYLSGKTSGRNKIGTQSFVKLIQKLESDTGAFRTGRLDQALNGAKVAASARLKTDSIASMALEPEAASLLGRDRMIRASDGLEIGVEEGWLKGLKLLFPEAQVSRLGGGAEAVAFEISDQQGSRVFKSFEYAADLQLYKPREGDVGAAYSKALLGSPHLATATHYLMGFGDGTSAPQSVLRVPADRVKELAKESHQAAEGAARWLVYGLEMPRAAGRSLDEQGPLSDRDVSQIARGLQAGLNDLAAHNAIHNDIKPENIVYDPGQGRTQIIDFGGLVKLSKTQAQNGQRPLAQSALAETQGFMAPWLKGSPFGVERDRYAAAMTLLASLMIDPKNSQGAAVTSSRVIIEALRTFERAADRPAELLGDVLAQIREKNPLMYQQLQSRLDQNPQLADYLAQMFASAVPGAAGDSLWSQLQGHPFVAA